MLRVVCKAIAGHSEISLHTLEKRRSMATNWTVSLTKGKKGIGPKLCASIGANCPNRDSAYIVGPVPLISIAVPPTKFQFFSPNFD